jgi:hypothetical protein
LSEDRNLRETLLEFGRRFVTLSTSPAMLGVYRATVSEAQRFPGLARIFYERGPGRAESLLAELLETANQKGEAQIADCTIAASHFIECVATIFTCVVARSRRTEEQSFKFIHQDERHESPGVEVVTHYLHHILDAARPLTAAEL